MAPVLRGFVLSLALEQLRGIRVFVTGNMLRPGSHNPSSPWTVVSAPMRGGGRVL